MAVVNKSRLVQINRIAFDQVDIFQSNFFTRITGLTPADVTLSITFNNEVVAWPLVDGSAVTNGEVASGKVYWSQLVSGAYGLRFYPNALGLWSLSVSYAASPQQITIIEFDVINLPLNYVDQSIRAGFCV